MDSNTPINFVANAHTLRINGISMKWLSPLRASNTICGEQWMRRATCWMSCCNDIETRKRHMGSSANCVARQGFTPRVIVTDKLKSYAAARGQVLKSVEHRYSQGIESESREFPPTDSSARATDAEIQITRTSATISLRFWIDSRSFPS